ncbi:MAG TPA: tetratricopeptide repeat protein [Pyrinomonadaceae bacterium]|nr:tetratricopeptide repeat protein [Pyrinomonadaceae bacterium]
MNSFTSLSNVVCGRDARAPKLTRKFAFYQYISFGVPTMIILYRKRAGKMYRFRARSRCLLRGVDLFRAEATRQTRFGVKSQTKKLPVRLFLLTTSEFMKIQRLIFAFAVLLSILFFPPSTVSAKDEWTRVSSKNFNLIGNADEKNIRAVGVRLEQFREALREIFNGLNFDSPIPTTVVVFKSAADFKPYKPIKANGDINDIAAGYFLPGDDVNYITLVGGETSDAYSTIFHEYTHFLIRNNLGESVIPAWYNEGIAEYYETFTVAENRTITLGAAQTKSAALLARSSLIPFETFFGIDNYSLHEQGDEAVGLFYAQAWALTHYLIHGNGGARKNRLDKFLVLLLAGKAPKPAFAEAFQIDYAAMETELKKYIEQSIYPVTSVLLKNALNVGAELKSAALSDADAAAYLGDLLYRSNRFAEAEAHLRNSLILNPQSATAYNTLGLLKLRQLDFIDARKYLEKAVELDSANYLAHYNYAYVLSREAMTEFGFVSEYDRETADRMRKSLRKAIELNPNFAESYNLYAFVGMVRNEAVDEAIEYLNKALKIAPGNQWYLIHLAELYMRKENFASARSLALKVAQTAGDEELKVYSQNTLRLIISTEAAYEAIKNRKKRLPEDGVLDAILTDEEFARLRAQRILESLNRALYRPKPGEKRILGYLTEVVCEPREMTYSIKVADKIIKLRSASFYTVNLIAYNPAMASWQIDCGAMKNESLAVISYRPSENDGLKIAGEIVSIEFVPNDFKFLDADIKNPTN